MAKSHLEKYLGKRRRVMLVYSAANVAFIIMSAVVFSSRKNRPQRMVYYRLRDVERTVRIHCGWRGSVKTSLSSS